MSESRPQSVKFSRRLSALRASDQRGALAALRRGLDRRLGENGPATAAFYRLLPREVGEYDEPWYYLAATLFARQPSASATVRPAHEADSPDTNRDRFPVAVARLARRPAVNEEGVARRFNALLDADQEALPFRLRTLMAMFRGHGDLLWDWSGLVDDLCRWSLPARPIQRAWARDFYALVAADDHSVDGAKEDHDAD